jgi:hypothetical protein
MARMKARRARRGRWSLISNKFKIRISLTDFIKQDILIPINKNKMF